MCGIHQSLNQNDHWHCDDLISSIVRCVIYLRKSQVIRMRGSCRQQRCIGFFPTSSPGLDIGIYKGNISGKAISNLEEQRLSQESSIPVYKRKTSQPAEIQSVIRAPADTRQFTSRLLVSSELLLHCLLIFLKFDSKLFNEYSKCELLMQMCITL